MASDPHWSVFVLMAVDTVPPNADLADAALEDIDEMLKVGSSERLKLAIRKHHNGNAEAFKVGARRRSATKASLVPMGEPTNVPLSPDTITAGPVLNPDARHTVLVLWGHAYDFTFGQTLDAGIGLDEIRKDAWVQEVCQPEAGRPLDIVGFDACDASTIEVACQFHKFSRYLLASQIGVPIPGWPYNTILAALATRRAKPMSPENFGAYAVRRYCEAYPASRVSLSLVDLDLAPTAAAYVRVLACALKDAIKDETGSERVVTAFERAQTGLGKPYVDLADLCLNLARDSGNSRVMAAARAVGDFLVGGARSRTPAAGVIVLEHGRRGYSTAKLNGLSIYAPHVAPENWEAIKDIKKRYDDLAFTRMCPEWNEVVHELARRRLGVQLA